MPKPKIAITLEESTLERLDELVEQSIFRVEAERLRKRLTRNSHACSTAGSRGSAPNSILFSKKHSQRKDYQRTCRHGPNIEGGDPLG